MRNPIEAISAFASAERPKHLAASLGFAAVAGLSAGLEAGLLERFTATGIFVGLLGGISVPVGSTSLAIYEFDKFLNPTKVSEAVK